MKQALLLALFANLFLPSMAQKESNPLKKHEVQLLSLLLDDSINNTNFTLNNSFNFGLGNDLFTNSNIIKKGKDLYIQPLGTGRLYKAIKENGVVKLDRMDLTKHSGSNFYAQNFFINDTLYQMGGVGFWHIRGILTYYSNQTRQWEIIQANKNVQTYFDGITNAVMHYDEKRKDPKLYVSNSYYYPNYPSSFETASTDSCYVYDFNTRRWNTLGKLNPEFIKTIGNNQSHEMELHINNLYIFQTQLKFYWLDFEKNKLGEFNNAENDRLRDFWLSSYNNNKSGFSVGFQFNLGDELYFLKLDNNDSLIWEKTTFNLKSLNLNKTIPIYTNNKSFLETITFFYSQYKTEVYLGLSLLLIAIALRANFFRKKRMPKEVVVILYQNFYNAITVQEKELLEVLYNSSLTGDEVSTKTINKIIGVQQKDTLSQNKSRSDHFIKINQKFKMATQNAEALVVKNRDKADKRQYNYGLNKKFMIEIEKLLKD
jgi:hypothetical protein